MPEFIAPMESQAPAPPAPLAEPQVLEFTVLSQKLEFEVDFLTRSLTGTTVLEIQPLTKDLRTIKVNARQCEIPVGKVTVNGRPCKVDYEDSYRRMNVPDFVDWSADNWLDQKEKIRGLVQNTLEPELSIHLPKGFAIKEANAEQLGELSNTSGLGPALAASAITSNSDVEYLPIHVSIPFSAKNFREGLHFVGLEEGSLDWPHVYTQQSPVHSGISRCIFPCFDNPKVKPLWTISIKCGRTLGDALTRKPAQTDEFRLDAESRLREMIVVCSGDVIKDVIDPGDSTKKIVTFEVAGNMVWAGHISFAIGPFEYVNLSEHRDQKEDRLGQQAVKVNGYCLPGRSEEVDTAAQAMAHAIDHFCMTYGTYPFTDYTLCFVQDQIQDTVDSASLTLCSDRLLHTEEIIDEMLPVTRKLVHALARQYAGVSLLPDKPEDTWVVIGIAIFTTDWYLSKLYGTNEYQIDLEKRADRLLELDLQRPSLFALGSILPLGQFELDFMELKAPLVLHMLDRRIAKKSGSTGLTRVISKIFTTASTGASKDDARMLTTDAFQKVCERLGHIKLFDFFKQWVHHSGYPRFVITQKFDKKNFRVKMTIKQIQGPESPIHDHKLKKSEFERLVKEEVNQVYASTVSNFTGPMTIRIVEADGTPYEHIIEIDSREKTIEIPYYTKYKRIGRNRRQRERENAAARGDLDGPIDNSWHCFGDILQSDREVEEWKLTDWDQDTFAKMKDESFEWIRIDADHEWRISHIEHAMEPYMYASQLQQDPHVGAHINSIKFMAKYPPNPVISSILVRTLMDTRYYYGVRALAAETLAAHATEASNWIGKFHLEKAFATLFCYPNTRWNPLPNNFEDFETYQVRNAIVTAMANIRDNEGSCPLECQTFIYDQLRLNDSSDTVFSDSYYIANLLKALGDSMVPRKVAEGTIGFAAQISDEEKEDLQIFQQRALEEIERYQKIDETMGSWRNVYTRAALESRKRLMEAKIIRSDHQEFLAYIQEETLDLVRIDAMAALVDLGMLFRFDHIISLFLNIMNTASSPFLRDQYFQIFWRGLASLAFGDHLEEEPDAMEDGVVVYQGPEQSEARAAKIARTTDIKSALAALKNDLQNNAVLKNVLWEAIKEPLIGLSEQMALLEYCSMLYDPVSTFPVKLILPRYWRVENRGKGRLGFKRTSKVRMKLSTDASLLAPAPTVAAVPTPAPAPKKLKVANSGEMRAPAKPSAPKLSVPKPSVASRPPTAPKRAESVSSTSTVASHSQPTAGPARKAKPSKIVIFRVKDKEFLRQLSHSKAPAGKKRKAEDDIPSPVPMPPPSRPTGIKIKFGGANGGPNSVSVSRTPTPGDTRSTPAPPTKIRIPLPDGRERKPLPDSSGEERKPVLEARTPLPDSAPKKRMHPSEDGDDGPPRKVPRVGVVTLKIGKRAKNND